MLTLLLLRHAKSDWDDTTARDYDRPLAARGIAAAPRIAAHMAAHALIPDLVLCSQAVRTRETWELVAATWRAMPMQQPLPEVVYEAGLYLADSDRLLARVRAVPAHRRCVLVVGHNPGMEDLARRLAGRGDRVDLDQLATKYPTGGLAVVTFEARAWSEVRDRGGTLARFVTPRALAEQG